MLYKLILAMAVLCLSWYVLSDLFDEDNITHLTGCYYTASYDNGTALHLYQDASRPYGKPLLDRVYAAYRSSRYLVVRAGINLYFLYPLRATSVQKAEESRVGALTKNELMKELLHLTGDTTLAPVGSF
ncbi:hypothetical protein P1X16_07565 [Hymenobacter sp. YC55]|nr:hypothetical protein [Hymenobacter sp. YC55]